MVVLATSSNQVQSVIYSKTQLQDWQKSTTQDNTTLKLSVHTSD